jgi:hypothetical protein
MYFEEGRRNVRGREEREAQKMKASEKIWKERMKRIRQLTPSEREPVKTVVTQLLHEIN